MKTFNYSLYNFIKFYKTNGLFNTMAIVVFFYLLYASSNSIIATLCSTSYLVSILIVYYRKSSALSRHVWTIISITSFNLVLYISRPDFSYITQFIYIVPLLYAISLRDFYTPSICGVSIIIIFISYIDNVGQSVIRATTIRLIFACIGYTVNSTLANKLKKDNEKLYKMSITDNLTGLATLAHTIETGQKMIVKGNYVTALIIDLDNFKQFNDTYGHLDANNILIKFSRLLKLKTSHLDSIVGRLGGDEFIIIVQNYDSSKQSLKNYLQDSLKDELYEIEKGLGKIKIDFSVGEAFSENLNPDTIEELLNRADINMYYNKLNSHKVYTSIEANLQPMSPQCMQLIETLAEKDMFTYIHSQYTAYYAEALAKTLNLHEHTVKDLHIAGWFHDIGKVLITNNILRKNTKLDQYEYHNIKQHVINGLNIIKNCNFSDTVINAIMFHHERWDGKGYPNEVLGKYTPIEGRILQIADAFSAMTVKRVYHEPLSTENALAEIQKNSGTQFDPQLTKIFIDMLSNKKLAI